MAKSEYRPQPIDMTAVVLADELLLLVERLARHAHDLWACQRLADGWRWGEARCDIKKEHPCLVPYEMLAESEKEYDRLASIGVLKALLSLGYSVMKLDSQPTGVTSTTCSASDINPSE